MIFLSDFYRSIFGCKTYKISLDAGCTCPNRDGTKGTGGCIFCSERGSGDFASSKEKSILEQIEQGLQLVEKKAKGRSGIKKTAYIAYFQNFTSTYGDAEQLISKYNEALKSPSIEGISIATRPDCLNDQILEFLAQLSQKTYVQLELGLQTSNEATGKLINRCYTDDDYIEAIKQISKKAPKIHIVTHLIFGLPGETEKDMMESLDFVIENNQHNIQKSTSFLKAKIRFWGIKITVLYIVKNTKLAQMYYNDEVAVLSKERYFELLQKAVSRLPAECVVHRLTGDPPKNMLIAPEWTTDKKRVLNEISRMIQKTHTD